MCDNWKKNIGNEYSCDGTILDSGKGEYIVKGRINSRKNNPKIMFWAANPPTYTTSYSGAGLPFPNSEIAFENTPNKGSVIAKNRQFEIRVRYPNSYYAGLGSLYIEPCVHVKVCGEDNVKNKIQTIKLGNGIPFRSLTYPPISEGTRARRNPSFYNGRYKLPLRSQETILRESAYPSDNIMPKNFWGKAVPHE